MSDCEQCHVFFLCSSVPSYFQVKNNPADSREDAANSSEQLNRIQEQIAAHSLLPVEYDGQQQLDAWERKPVTQPAHTQTEGERDITFGVKSLEGRWKEEVVGNGDRK